ncbi:C2 domain-containing protein 5 isoform X2 [Diorhabda sublineata]|uniref:C2 domain-containing protein 5 isoform X2 n=1 Tax=Diorhabda sublineata TaxID=1163346 RepID=UPI0024E19376|nr:C2 domain-containing protein 5 isoform X2 [Diorhabda sublineata]
MPGKVKVKISSGKNLPVMDRSSDTTDAYVEIKLGSTTFKTDVCRKSLHPQWNTDWYRFEVEDSELQDEPLQIRLMDHDTYSANDAIGKVYLNLNPLLLPVDGPVIKYGFNGDSSIHHEISGWLPVYDTMHGIRGEVNITVKVELFSDFNRFRQSSCGIQFFYSPTVPQGYQAKLIHGFVEELLVYDDPEYQWIDKIRTPRASNEARQTLFFKLSGELQRKIGVKTISLGGNAVIGYKQSYDLEGESGIVARGIGTAVTLIKSTNICNSVFNGESKDDNTKHACITPNRHNISPQPEQIGGNNCQHNLDQRKNDQSPSRTNNFAQRRSSDSDLSTTPKGNSLTNSDKSGGPTTSSCLKNNITMRSQIHQENFDMLEYPFLTVMKFPVDFIAQIGGAVCARSVKRLETIRNIEEPESRDTWWSELRMEIRSHARSLNCNAVLGYSESTSICDDICILSASGTAVIINFHRGDDIDEYVALLKQNINLNPSSVPNDTSSVSSYDKDKQKTDGLSSNKHCDSPEHINNGNSICSVTHLPYNSSNIPLKTALAKCSICRKGKVPEVIIATIEPSDGLPSTGRGCFIESYVCRPLKDLKCEWIAKEISDGLPFLEYELHRLLVNKLKIKGMNAIFGLKFRITVGEKMMIATAAGTAIYLSSLPSPSVPKLVSDENSDDAKLVLLQRQLNETVKKNREIYQIEDRLDSCRVWSDDESEEEATSLDLSSGSKDCCVLEVDDPKDEEVLFSLMKERPPDGFHVVNTENIPGLDDLEIVKNLQMFTQIRRFKFHSNLNIDEYFTKLLQSVYFKLRRMVPCALCNIQFRCDIPEPDEVQLLVFGMALGLGKTSKEVKSVLPKRNEDDMIFKLDEDNIPENAISGSKSGRYTKQRSSSRYKSLKQRHTPQKEIHGVDITPLSYVPGASIDKYLGNINFFFIRETTSIREEGGLSGFLHSFVTEVLAIVRAHVSALGGNALVAFFLTELFLHHNFHKNQGQCLINVGGDVVSVTYQKGDS